MNSDLLIIQNDRTKQTWLYTNQRPDAGLVEADEEEFVILQGLAAIIRSQLYDNEKLVDEIKRISQENDN